MLEIIKFVLFSMIESFAVTVIMLTLFRYKIWDYIVPLLMLSLIMSLQSLVLRDLSIAPFVPLINILLLTFFAVWILRIPMIWSIIISFSGYVATVLLQVIIVAVSDGYLTPKAIQANPVNGYILQVLTGVIMFVISQILYKYGIGTAVQFEKFRFKWERNLLLFLIVVLMVSLTVLFYYREVCIDLIFLLLALIFFTYYTIRKETEQNDSRLRS